MNLDLSLDLNLMRGVGDRFHNALTLVDIAALDQPLVYVNQAFVALTGYTAAESLGRNCRFLQGVATATADVLMIRTAIANSQAIFCDLCNYRKDGSTFFNRLVLVPLQLRDGPHYVGMQIDAAERFAEGISLGKSFDQLKITEMIRDRINSPLMKICTAYTLTIEPEICRSIMERAFAQIRELVDSL